MLGDKEPPTIASAGTVILASLFILSDLRKIYNSFEGGKSKTAFLGTKTMEKLWCH